MLDIGGREGYAQPMPFRASNSNQLHFTDAVKLLGAFGSAADGDVLTWDSGTNTFRPEAAAAAGIGGSTGGTTNRVLVADGPGGGTLKASGLTADGSNNLSGVAALSATTIELGHASDTTLSRVAAGVVAVEGVRLQPVSSASDPTVNDDSGDGYAVGQVWVNTTSDAPFILVDATVGAAVWRSLLTPASALFITVSGGALVAYEQAYTGGGWVNVSAALSPTVETDGGVTFSGTTLTIPSGIAATSATQSQADERYWAVSSLSAGLQALVAANSVIRVEVGEDAIDLSVTNARWGVSVTSATGSFDAAAENLASFRTGGNGTQYAYGYAAGANAFSTLITSASDFDRLASWVIGYAAGTAVIGTSSSTTAQGTAVPTRIYVTASASGSATAASCAVTRPWARISFIAPVTG